MDVDAAGELAPKVVKQQEAHELIKHVRANYPVDLVTLEQRDEDRPRTAALDADEVLEAAAEAFGDSGQDGGVTKIFSARVRGKSQPISEKAVCVLWLTPSGRTARGAIGYSDLEESVEAFDRMVAAGEITEVDETDSKDLKRTVERQEDLIKRLNAKLDDKGADPAADEGVAPEDIPEGVVPGETPGWPIVNGIVVDLPDEVREQLANVALGDDAEEGDPEPVEAPTGKAPELIASVGDFSPEQLKALIAAEQDDETPRQTVIAAAEKELAKRDGE
jgi:hypothetical protein